MNDTRPFVEIMQFADIYEHATGAKKFYDADEPGKGLEEVQKAFNAMLARLSEQFHRTPERLLGDDTIFTELSLRNYRMYAVAENEGEETLLGAKAASGAQDRSVNPLYALMEETKKFGMYMRGMRLNEIEELYTKTSTSHWRSPEQRRSLDTAFALIVILLFMVGGVVLLTMSAFARFSHLLPGGIVCLIFGLVMISVLGKGK